MIRAAAFVVALALTVAASAPAGALTLCLGNCNCSVATTPLMFGSYDPTSPAVVDSTAVVTVTCRISSLLGLLGLQVQVNYDLALNGGASGNPAARAMSSTLGYGLYLDPARTIPWGDGSNGTSTISGSHILLTTMLQPVVTSYTVYGRLPAGQAAPAGAYGDAVTVTLTY